MPSKAMCFGRGSLYAVLLRACAFCTPRKHSKAQVRDDLVDINSGVPGCAWHELPADTLVALHLFTRRKGDGAISVEREELGHDLVRVLRRVTFKPSAAPLSRRRHPDSHDAPHTLP